MSPYPKTNPRGPKKPFSGRPGGDKRRHPTAFVRKPCQFCVEKNATLDYKLVNVLRNFITDRGKMLSARVTGICAKHQRKLTVAIKRARNLALLPFAAP